MQTAESVCLWNYQFKNNLNKDSLPSSTSNASPGKGCLDKTPYLACTERLACENDMSSKATFYCLQCNSLQCVLCEGELHQSAPNQEHERLNLDEIDDEYCSVDRRHQAVFYCPTCAASFCYLCYENQHQHSASREHKPQKCREGQLLTPKKKIRYAHVIPLQCPLICLSSEERRTETKPIDIVPPSNESPASPKPSAHSFEDVHVDDSQQPTASSHTAPSSCAPERLTCNEQMLLESMLDENDATDSSSPKKRSSFQSDRGFLLIDANECLTVSRLSLRRKTHPRCL